MGWPGGSGWREGCRSQPRRPTGRGDPSPGLGRPRGQGVVRSPGFARFASFARFAVADVGGGAADEFGAAFFAVGAFGLAEVVDARPVGARGAGIALGARVTLGAHRSSRARGTSRSGRPLLARLAPGTRRAFLGRGGGLAATSVV